MFNLKKTARALLALFIATSATFAVACDNTNTPQSSSSSESVSNSESNSESSSVSESDSSSDSTDDGSCAHVWKAAAIYTSPTCTTKGERAYVCENDPSHVKVMEVDYAHNWSNWFITKNSSCLDVGEKGRYCLDCEGVTETAPVALSGHNYDNGICGRCGHGPVYPDAPATITYYNPQQLMLEDGLGLDPYAAYPLTSGYYEFILGDSGAVYFSCTAEQAGQYAMYSTNAPAGVTAKNYGSNAYYVPEDGNGNYLGTEARALEDGNFYASANVDTTYWHDGFLFIFGIHGEPNTKVRVRFVYIDAAETAAEYQYDPVYPQQINGKAPDAESGTILKEADFKASYFYDSNSGYYRLGTAENPGAILYAAITKKATRISESLAFSELAPLGVRYTLFHSTAVDGTKIYKDYSWFLCNYGGEGTISSDLGRTFIPNPADEKALCYQNYVNSDGVYPVTPELKEFLDLYVSSNTPVSLQGETDESKLANAWLAACYYYQKAATGSETSPIEVTPETFEVTTKLQAYKYYTLLATATETTTYVVTITDADAFINFNGTAYSGACSFEITLNAGESKNFFVGSISGEKITFTIQIVAKV